MAPGPAALIDSYGGYRGLRSFQVAQVVYDATTLYCHRSIDKRIQTLYQRRKQTRGRP